MPSPRQGTGLDNPIKHQGPTMADELNRLFPCKRGPMIEKHNGCIIKLATTTRIHNMNAGQKAGHGHFTQPRTQPHGQTVAASSRQAHYPKCTAPRGCSQRDNHIGRNHYESSKSNRAKHSPLSLKFPAQSLVNGTLVTKVVLLENSPLFDPRPQLCNDDPN